MSDKQTRKRLQTKLTAPLLAHHIKGTALCSLICTSHLQVSTVHMTWEDLIVGAEVDTFHPIQTLPYRKKEF